MKNYLSLSAVFFSLLLSSCCCPIILNGWNDTYRMPGIINTATMKLTSNELTVLSIDKRPVKLFPMLDSIRLTPGSHDIALYFEGNAFYIPQVKKLVILRALFQPNELYFIKSDGSCNIWIENQAGFLVSWVRSFDDIQKTEVIKAWRVEHP